MVKAVPLQIPAYLYGVEAPWVLVQTHSQSSTILSLTIEANCVFDNVPSTTLQYSKAVNTRALLSEESEALSSDDESSLSDSDPDLSSDDDTCLS